MDPLQAFLEDIKRLKLGKDHLLGLFHILIGRRVSRDDGTLVSSGMTWRELAALLKKVRWSKDAVLELDMNPENLAPRDREKFWYTAIAKAGVNSDQARAEGDKLAKLLETKGYVVSVAPSKNP